MCSYAQHAIIMKVWGAAEGVDQIDCEFAACHHSTAVAFRNSRTFEQIIFLQQFAGPAATAHLESQTGQTL